MTQQDKPSPPIKEFRAGNLEASIWRNEVQADGRARTRHSIRIKKQFRTEDGSYQDTNYFFPSELPQLALLANRAFEYVVLSEDSPDSDEPGPV
jgi:hypothetical protein